MQRLEEMVFLVMMHLSMVPARMACPETNFYKSGDSYGTLCSPLSHSPESKDIPWRVDSYHWVWERNVGEKCWRESSFSTPASYQLEETASQSNTCAIDRLLLGRPVLYNQASRIHSTVSTHSNRCHYRFLRSPLMSLLPEHKL
jgi:hypothetical protein